MRKIFGEDIKTSVDTWDISGGQESIKYRDLLVNPRI
jgi:hypothetical protein